MDIAIDGAGFFRHNEKQSVGYQREKFRNRRDTDGFI